MRLGHNMDLSSWEVFENVFSDAIYETPSEVHSLCSSEDYICAGLRSGVIWVLDLATSEPIELKSHTNTVNSLALSQSKLVSGGQDSSIFIWDLQSYTKIGQIPAHEGVITGFDLSSPFLYSTSIDQTIKKFDFLSVCQVAEAKLDSVGCCVKVNNDRVYLGCEEGFIQVLSLNLDKVFKFDGHLDAIWCIDCFCDLIVSCSFDGTVRVWDSETGSSQVIGEHEGVVNKIGIFDPSNTGIPLIVSVGSDKLVKLWALDGLKDSWKFHTDAVSAVAVLDMFIVTAGFDKKIRLWSLLNHLKIKQVSSSSQLVQDFDLVESEVWTLEKGKILAAGGKREDFDKMANGVSVKAFAVDVQGKVLVVGYEKSVKVLGIDSGEVLKVVELDDFVRGIVARNKEILVVAARKCFWVVGDNVESFEFDGVSGDFNERFIVCAGKMVRVMDKRLNVLNEKNFAVDLNCVLLSRNSRFVYVAGSDGIHILALDGLERLCHLTLFQGFSKMKLHPVSQILVSSGKVVYLIPEYDVEKQIMLP